MSKKEQDPVIERIDEVCRDLKETYGPVMRRQDLAEMLKMHPASADRWACQRGLWTHRIGAGRYNTRDVARALVLGCA